MKRLWIPATGLAAAWATRNGTRCITMPLITKFASKTANELLHGIVRKCYSDLRVCLLTVEGDTRL